jgi:hypothetical protein
LGWRCNIGSLGVADCFSRLFISTSSNALRREDSQSDLHIIQGLQAPHLANHSIHLLIDRDGEVVEGACNSQAVAG